MPHIIRLRGPWMWQPLDLATRCVGAAPAENERPPGGRFSMPAKWTDPVGTDYRGRVQYIRPFGMPTGLEPADRVQLIVAGSSLPACVCLNGRVLGEITGTLEEFCADVTDRLKLRNRLTIQVDITGESSPVLSCAASKERRVDVRLEIYSEPEGLEPGQI